MKIDELIRLAEEQIHEMEKRGLTWCPTASNDDLYGLLDANDKHPERNNRHAGISYAAVIVLAYRHINALVSVNQQMRDIIG